MTFLDELRAEAAASVTMLGHRSMWDDIVTGAWGCFALAIRLLILMLFPISVPLIAWIVVKDKKLRLVQEAEARKRMRAAYLQAYGPAASTLHLDAPQQKEPT